MIIAVDGPAASGKGTLAQRLAGHFGIPYLETGLLYRAAGLAVLRAGGDPADEQTAARAAEGLDLGLVHDPETRSEAAGNAASLVSGVPAVRQALLDHQRRLAAQPGGAVLDGRDIGTVVCPDADAKIFITAPAELRAERRFRQLREQGHPAIYAEILRDMKARDERDSRRAVAPLEPAVDAFVLDTGRLDAEQVFAQALAFIAHKAGHARPGSPGSAEAPPGG
jgi:cytidylate kinase